MLHHMKLQSEPFRKIRDGQKTVELRLYDLKRRKICVGDHIEFMNLEDHTQKMRVCVTALHVFDSFESLYNCLPPSLYGYDKTSHADPKDMEKYYPKEKEMHFGVLGIEFVLIPWRDQTATLMSRYISKILRHHPELAGISLDAHGWADVDDLLQGINQKYALSIDQLKLIVVTDDKQRFSFNKSKTKIRANQAHSICVDVDLEETPPPEILWHGTSTKNVESIEQKGLMSGSRLYVHLSTDYETAISVGGRHGSPIVYAINSAKMYNDGFRFYKSINGTWLTKYVPVMYIHKVRSNCSGDLANKMHRDDLENESQSN